LFRGSPASNHVEEEKQYDRDVHVLWQPKAWADLTTCIEWAKGPFKKIVDEFLPDTDSLLLADNLKSQTKDEFKTAVKENGRAQMLFGPKGATYIWQPIDHHIGRLYSRRMGVLYDEWMQDRSGPFNLTVGAAERRVLMTKWAGQVYRYLEREREASEAAGEKSRFYMAFLSTGCLINADRSRDDEIKPHDSIKGDVEVEFRRQEPRTHTLLSFMTVISLTQMNQTMKGETQRTSMTTFRKRTIMRWSRFPMEWSWASRRMNAH
jgi:hypothetical protein